MSTALVPGRANVRITAPSRKLPGGSISPSRRSVSTSGQRRGFASAAHIAAGGAVVTKVSVALSTSDMTRYWRGALPSWSHAGAAAFKAVSGCLAKKIACRGMRKPPASGAGTGHGKEERRDAFVEADGRGPALPAGPSRRSVLAEQGPRRVVAAEGRV